MNVIFSNDSQNMEMDSYGMLSVDSTTGSACDPIASCDGNFDN